MSNGKLTQADYIDLVNYECLAHSVFLIRKPVGTPEHNGLVHFDTERECRWGVASSFMQRFFTASAGKESLFGSSGISIEKRNLSPEMLLLLPDGAIQPGDDERSAYVLAIVMHSSIRRNASVEDTRTIGCVLRSSWDRIT